MTDRVHPADAYSKATAPSTNSHLLTRHFEEVSLHEDPCWRAGGLETIASVAIARVALLEKQLAAQERSARAGLFQRTGNVIPLGSKRAPLPDDTRRGA